MIETIPARRGRAVFAACGQSVKEINTQVRKSLTPGRSIGRI
jgi:hypothetical protein